MAFTGECKSRGNECHTRSATRRNTLTRRSAQHTIPDLAQNNDCVCHARCRKPTSRSGRAVSAKGVSQNGQWGQSWYISHRDSATSRHQSRRRTQSAQPNHATAPQSLLISETRRLLASWPWYCNLSHEFVGMSRGPDRRKLLAAWPRRRSFHILCLLPIDGVGMKRLEMDDHLASPPRFGCRGEKTPTCQYSGWRRTGPGHRSLRTRATVAWVVVLPRKNLIDIGGSNDGHAFAAAITRQ